eukprot:m.110802 g.110802  ORF g.110802 m.110802 type:complete len:484 (+) comp15927_c0_seq1:248-1699(+)
MADGESSSSSSNNAAAAAASPAAGGSSSLRPSSSSSSSLNSSASSSSSLSAVLRSRATLHDFPLVATSFAVVLCAAIAASSNVYLWINLCMAVGAYVTALLLIPATQGLFEKAELAGYDLNKVERCKIPEGLGVIAASVYLVIMFMYIPLHLESWLAGEEKARSYEKLLEFVSALLAICCMVFLGFADDVLDLKWRHKLLLPTIASLPLLMVYFITYGGTNVIVPLPLRGLLGVSVNLGFIYYIYMSMLAVFCTNAVNILAGINGVEAGQSLVIGLSILTHNFIQMQSDDSKYKADHELCAQILMPFVAVTAALLYHNWFPSKVFVGDTFCYFAGMTFAVVGILGHFSKTVLLFFMPQIFNFVYSLPQLFRFIPCPRHRLPKLNPQTKLLGNSYATFSMAEIGTIGRIIVKILKTFRLADVQDENPSEVKLSNMTIINFVLLFTGPTHEKRLANHIMLIQVACSCLALLIRYPLAKVFFEVVE